MTRFLAGTARGGRLQTENVFRRQAQATRRRPVVSTDKYVASLFAACTKGRGKKKKNSDVICLWCGRQEDPLPVGKVKTYKNNN